jgi:hypothetical protein
MSAPNLQNVRHSADVQMRLIVNGSIFLIGQLGPDFVILDEPMDHPPGTGEISVSIDGHESRWPVQLPAGVAAGEPETRMINYPANFEGAAVG